MTIIHVAISLLPVVFFLAVLILIDSYKLVRARWVLFALLAGAIAAGFSYFTNTWLLSFGIDDKIFSRYPVPAVEEFYKAAFVAYLVAANRVGFTVDAAIQGFAVGAGFAVIENIYYHTELGEATLRIWMIRGLGTAIMHGGTMAVFAILAKSFRDRRKASKVTPYLIAYAAAFILHSSFNHFFLPAELGTIVQLLVFSLVITVLFQESEKLTRSWLGTGFDTDQELLRSIITGEVSDTHVGEYLSMLKRKFDGPIVVDMLCLVRIRVELSVRAKGIMMMRKAGFKVAPDPDTRYKFAEMKYLEKSIGRVGLIAIEPVHQWTRRDLWQLNVIDVSGSSVDTGGRKSGSTQASQSDDTASS
ncbi:MAG: hypothetical protein BMS9Abin05_2099 [Rhodothermia bacterium]|nr:MAG: hypothetical protein BMS9Abin05_2099 [Rhodothermia bacterium]